MKRDIKDIIRGFANDYDALVQRIMEGPDEEIINLATDLTIHLRSETNPTVNQYKFIANESLSGGPHPCTHFQCRLKKLDEVVSFACFYADTVYIQDPFEKTLLDDNETLTHFDRSNILFGITAYLRLEPLYKKGIIKYAQSLVSVCKTHEKLLVDPLKQKRVETEERIRESIIEELFNSCSFVFNITEQHGPFIEMSGPEELIDHGRSYYYFTKLPEFFKYYANNNQLPYNLSKSEVVERNILKSITFPIIDDLYYQEWHSAFNNTHYLSDNETQMRLASRLNNQEEVSYSEALLHGLRHSLPIAFSKDVNEIIKIRESESEAFEVYRDKIRKLTKEARGGNQKHIREMFNDTILPEINQINKQIADRKRLLRDSVYEKLLFGVGTVAVGLYSGILPTDIGKVVAAFGGCKCIAETLMEFNKSLKDEQEARKNDLYFLWKINE